MITETKVARDDVSKEKPCKRLGFIIAPMLRAQVMAHAANANEQWSAPWQATQ
ncbi:hypothetical protein [Andreprevotia chitinilytica]|uniref:hypothetical protein n=1 Tax=Andreprevotia chitinilytica TaxID=396808 RepID=UPI0012EC2A8E|nr:hypothetical protein [Andreprevotia chitinilytica]